MRDFINKLYRNHSLIYKGLLFVFTTFLIVYMFPKSGKFKYNFEKGKPWQSENLLAPFDFAILKSDVEIAIEKQEITDNSILYFDVETAIKLRVGDRYKQQFKANFSDSIPKSIRNNLYKTGQKIIDELYVFGISNEN